MAAAKDGGPAARVPPQSPEAEQAVLGAVILDDSCLRRVRRVLPRESPGQVFWREAHRLVWEACSRMHDRKPPSAVDLTTLAEELEARGELDRAGGRPYLLSLLDAVPTAAHAEQYAEILVRKWTRRSLVSVGTEIAEEAGEEGGWEEDGEGALVSRAVAAVKAIAEARVRPEVVIPASALADEAPGAYAPLGDVAGEDEEGLGPVAAPVVRTGLAAFDRLVGGGFPLGSHVLYAAETSRGKTALALQTWLRAGRDGIPSLFVSLEMPAEGIRDRLFQMLAAIPSQRLRRREVTEDEYLRLEAAAEEIRGLPLYLVTRRSLAQAGWRRPGISPGTVRDLVLGDYVGHLGLVIVDYLQIMRPDGRHENRTQEVTAISSGLQGLAQEAGVTLIALSQLSRPGPGSREARPNLWRLRESGSLEHNADDVVFIHHPDWEVRVSKAKDPDAPHAEGTITRAELIRAKGRMGAVGTVTVGWRADYARFEDVDLSHWDHTGADGSWGYGGGG